MLKGLKTGTVMSFMAVMISLFALAVSWQESQILRKQQQTSVWPYLEALPSFTSEYISVEVVNKGIGPAIIQDVQYVVGDQSVDGLDEFLQMVFDTTSVSRVMSSLQGRVMAPGESIQHFVITDPALIQRAFELRQSITGLDLRLCYCSIYEDCWRTENGSTYKSKNCP